LLADMSGAWGLFIRWCERVSPEEHKRLTTARGGTAMAGQGRWRTRISILLWFVGSLAVYLSNGRAMYSSDSVPTLLIPVASLLDGTVMLDPQAPMLLVTGLLFPRRPPGSVASAVALGVAIVLSVGAQALGVFSQAAASWNAIPREIPIEQRLWDWGDSPLMRGLRANL
jgi:hypothetical protein